MATAGGPKAPSFPVSPPARREVFPLRLPGPAAWHHREIAAASALVGLVGAAAVLVLESATTRRNFGVPHRGHATAGWIAGPFAVYGGRMTAARFILLLSAMWVCYLLVLALADSVRPRWAVGAIVTATALFTIGPPLLSTDVFNYIDYGRLGAIHHLNPYVHGPAAAPHDPVFRYAGWHHTPSAYGPLFTLVSYPIASLGLGGTLWSLKALTGAAILATVALVWRCARMTGQSPVAAGLFFGLNPVLLVFAVAGAHNDVLALFPIVAAMALALSGRPALAGASAVTAVAVKATAGLVLPFMVLGSRRRWSMLAGMAAATLAFASLALAIFGSAALSEPFRLTVQHQHYYFVHSVPPHVAALLGLGPHSSALRRAFELLAAVAIVALLIRTALSRDWLSGAGWATVATLVGTTYMLPWYTIWVLPFAAVARDRRLRVAALCLGTFVVAARLYYVNR
jgi:Glycosyltransferase family 87